LCSSLLMVLVQATKLPLPLSLPQTTTSTLFEPNSLSLALMHSDSSLSLFPSLPFPSLSSLLNKPQTLIPPPSSSSSFVLLQHQNPNPRVVFLVAGPHRGGTQILFRFYILKRNNLFGKAQILCNQKGISAVPKLGALLDMNHGASIKVVGSINYFAMHSVSSRKVWVFALKLIGDDEDGDVVKLMRCAVIECNVPVWSMTLFFGVLILGEDNGVRIFNLRQLAKGRVKKVKSSNSVGNLDMNANKVEGKGLKLPNGVIGPTCNGVLEGKPRSMKNRQHSGEGCASFVALSSKDLEGGKSSIVKAVSVQALSPKKFLILDSMGDMHIMTLSDAVGGSNIMPQIRRLPHCMKVQKLAIIPDVSSRIQTVWVSDGLYSLHVMTVSEVDATLSKQFFLVKRYKKLHLGLQMVY
ncbi:hypothetical protein Tsubulata_019371, partial [Turnera subulata]